MKWIFFDLGATLVDESDVYKSRCRFAIDQLNIDPEEFMNKVYEEARISPTPIRTAAEAGCAKPDLRIFKMALQKAKCEPNEAVMVGDRLDNDIVPAKELGMKTIWVRQGYAIYQSIDDERKRPDYIVDSIDELTGLKL